jgi:hypothetical protein
MVHFWKKVAVVFRFSIPQLLLREVVRVWVQIPLAEHGRQRGTSQCMTIALHVEGSLERKI